MSLKKVKIIVDGNLSFCDSHRMKDGCVSALERMLSLARLIRRRGTPEEASVITPYEIKLEADLKARLAQLEAEAQAQPEPQKEAA